MKFAYALVAFLILTSVATAQRVNLQDDSNKLTVTVFANSTAEANAFLNRHPEIARYKAGNHYNVYTQLNPMTKLRFPNQTHLSAYVSYANGQTVITAKDTTCPLRWRKNHQKKQEQQVDQGGVEGDDEVADSDEPVEPGLNHWLLVAAGALGLAIGAGGSIYKEVKAK